MLLCGIADICPGMNVGAPVLHPMRPSLELLRPGVALDAAMIRRLKAAGVHQLWVHHDATADLDHAVAGNLTAASLNVYRAINDTFSNLSPRTFFTGNLLTYRQVVMELITELISSQGAAGLCVQKLTGDQPLLTHSANVAYLSLFIGLELDAYVMQQRSVRDVEHARDMTNLGLGAMLHDIGKLHASKAVQQEHEITQDRDPDDEALALYLDHPVAGFKTLTASGAPATMVNTILHHHQRFDGTGWPDMAEVAPGRKSGRLAGEKIHIFSRIVAIANVLDNLTRDAEGKERPMVAALYDLAGPQYDGWFDPVVRDRVLRRVAPFPLGSSVTLSDGASAVVVAPNFDRPCRPAVRLLPQGERQPTVVDLSQHEDLTIHRCLGVDVTKWSYEVEPVAMAS